MDNSSLLQMFLSNPQEYISGEEISRKLSISRTAVWKQINKLRETGYEFDAVSRKGYRLVSKPSRLDPMTLAATLAPMKFGHRFHLLDVTTSTQELGHRHASEGAPEGTLIIAEEQTNGRGRMGRNWFSPPGKGVWMSLILRPDQSLSSASQLTLLTAVAVCRALRAVCGVDVGIKWPNDLLVKGRKVSGILLESVAEDERIRYCIAGIGIDVNLDLEDYPEDLRDIVTSLKCESGQTIDRVKLIGAVMKEFEKLYHLYREQGFTPIAELWEALSISLNRPVSVQQGDRSIKGTAIGLAMSGALVIEDESGIKHPIFSGEIHFG